MTASSQVLKRCVLGLLACVAAIVCAQTIPDLGFTTRVSARLTERSAQVRSRGFRTPAALVPLQGSAQASGNDLKTEIESAIQANRITLLGQKAATVTGQDVLHFEILCSLSDHDGKTISAGIFVPIANQHGPLPSLDSKVLGRVLLALPRLESLPRDIPLVAQGMEKIDAVAVSAELDLSGYQGYASGRPEQLPQA